jgi:hypothetical protein
MAKHSWTTWKPWKSHYIFYIVLYIIYCLAFYGVIVWVFYKNMGSTEHFEIQPSKIHGEGVFATEYYDPNQEVFLVVPKNDLVDDTPILQKYQITHLGRKVNHCSDLDKVNVHLVEKEDGWYLDSKTIIRPGDELIVDYNVNRPYFLAPADETWTC